MTERWTESGKPIPYLDGTLDRPEMPDFWADDDPLGPARGIVVGCLMTLVVLSVIGLALIAVMVLR
jgi:hypothetical protein